MIFMGFTMFRPIFLGVACFFGPPEARVEQRLQADLAVEGSA